MVRSGKKRGKYNLKARAERHQQTRQRIVETAMELHKTHGPSQTTITDIAKRAGFPTSEQLTSEQLVQLGLDFWGSKTLLNTVEIGLFTEPAEGTSTDWSRNRL